MNALRTIHEYDSLPADLRIIAIDFIEMLKKRNQNESKLPKKQPDIDEIRLKYFGIWKDRKDIEDSSEWVRNIRKTEMG